MEESVSNIIRLLAMIEAATDLSHPLTTPEVEAMCYMLSEHGKESGLRFRYSFRFGARPRSGRCYDDLTGLQNAGYVGRGLITITPEGGHYLDSFNRFSSELDLVRSKFKEVLPTYLKEDVVDEALRLAEA